MLSNRRLSALRPAAWTVTAALCSVPTPATAQPTPAAATPAPWYERLSFSGDLRARSESFFQAGRPMRHRPRVRVRLGLHVDVRPNLEVGFRLATGDPRDPTSTNQTLEDFFGRKPFYLDQAYLLWRPAWPRGLTVGAGKFPLPVLRTQMIWDDDLNCEGLYEQLAIPGHVTVQLTAIQAPLHEVSTGPDAAMFAAQGSVAFRTGPHRVQVGTSVYGFRRVDQIAVALASGDLRSQNWNLLRAQEGRVVGFASGFRLVDLIGQVTLATRRRDYPLALTGHWVRNLQAIDRQRTGFWLEARYGRASSPGTAAAGYTFARIARDAVLSAFAFSDMPSANTRAHILAGSFAPAARVNLDATAYFTKKILVEPGEANRLLVRLQLDARVSF